MKHRLILAALLASTTLTGCGLLVVGGAAATTPAQPCAQYRYSSFRAPNEATNINGSLWGVRFGVRVVF